jgi:AbrB family transcriptional regulator (stage V sporulation protein T)
MNTIKATGIIRKIDELGRVVIPKEIRRTMRIYQGDSLEIYTADDGEIILKKYSPIEDFARTASQLAEAANKVCGFSVIIMNKDFVVACAGAPKKDLIQHKISPAIENLINASRTYIWHSDEEKIPVVDIQNKYFTKAIIPIYTYGEPIGAVAIIGTNALFDESTESEIQIIQTTAIFLGKQAD